MQSSLYILGICVFVVTFGLRDFKFKSFRTCGRYLDSQRGLGKGAGLSLRCSSCICLMQLFPALPHDFTNACPISAKTGSTLRFRSTCRSYRLIESLWADRTSKLCFSVNGPRPQCQLIRFEMYLCVPESERSGHWRPTGGWWRLAGGWTTNINGIPNARPSQPPVSPLFLLLDPAASRSLTCYLQRFSLCLLSPHSFLAHPYLPIPRFTTKGAW